MLRTLLALASAGLVSASMGCSMCCAPFDPAFAAYGGSVERGDLYQGRVGSIFDPAGSEVVSYQYLDDTTIVEPESAFEPIEAVE